MKFPHAYRRRRHTHRQPLIDRLEGRTLMSVAATANVDLSSTTGSGAGTLYHYEVTLTNTGTTSIGTFWFAWEPGEDFLPSPPSATSSPSGWSAAVTGAGNSSDGSAVEWTTTSSPLAVGQSTHEFEFTTTDSPAALAAGSPTHAPTPATTSFVYGGAPFSDAGFMFVATVDQSTTPTPTPTPTPTTTPTTTTLAASTATANVGDSVTLTATVAPAAATGTVTFMSNGTALGTATLDGNGVASLATVALPAGADTVTAVYAGDATNAGSTSAGVTVTVAALPVESAAAQLHLVALSGTPTAPVYTYDLALTNTGTTTIGTFWFAWVPGENFLPTAPTSESSPAGWGNGAGTAATPDVTGPEGNPDGTGLRWVAQSADARLTPGASLAGFRFTTTDSPTALAGDAPSHPGTPIGTSFVYSGQPFSDGGVKIVAGGVTNPTAAHLEPSIDPAKVPANVATGAALNATVPITLTNFASATTKGTTTVTLFAAPDGRLDDSAVALGTAKKRVSIRPDGTAVVPVRLRKLPASVTDETYTLIASATDATGTTLASTEATMLTVAPPVVTLSATIAAAATTVTGGKPIVLTVAVGNTGNVNGSGRMTLDLALSTDGTTATVPLATVRRAVTVKPNAKAVTFRLKVKVPKGTAAGSYTPIVAVVQGNTSTQAVASATITVTD